MLDKLLRIEERYEELGTMLGDPEVVTNQEQYQKHAKAHASLDEVVTAFREYKKIKLEIEQTESLLQEELDAEMRELAEGELVELETKIEALEGRLKLLLLPRDPIDEKNVIMEIRAGTGGEEAALFAAQLYRMYNRYAERQGWRVELMDSHPTELGGIKEIVFSIKGKGAYSRLKFESGVHRVQRIPTTESSGRIHTSAATVAVLPEAEDVEVAIDPNDLRIDVFCASGHGGQSVNTTQSAVRITHLPTGIVVSCQDEKSQHKNKERGMRVLRARILDKARQEQHGEVASNRRSQVGSGDRSERIRTYNFPQGRLTDHRIGLTIYRLESILDGDIEDVIVALVTTDQAERFRQVE